MLYWLENTPVGLWVDISSWAYPFLLTVHGLGMAVVVGVTAVISLRVLGFPAQVPLVAYRKLPPIIWGAFLFNFLSGLVLYIADAQALTFNVAYQIKMVSVAVGLFLIWRLQSKVLAEAVVGEAEAGTVEPSSRSGEGLLLPRSAKFLAAAVVLVWWISVLVSGRLVAYLAAAA